MIPKTAHFYWGGSQLPFLRYLTLWSFCNFNPEWRVKLYIPVSLSTRITWKTNEQNYRVKNNDCFKRLEKLPVSIVKSSMERYGFSNSIPEVHKSDILRWNVLADEGGLWSDMDIFYVKGIESCFDVSSEKDYLCYDTIKKYYSIGFMLASHESPIMRMMANSCHKYYKRSEYQSVGSIMMKKVLGNIDKFSDSVDNMDMSIVYPFDSYNIDCLWSSKEYRIPDKTIGIHWYAGNKVSGEYISNINKKNFNKSKANLIQIISSFFDMQGDIE